MIQLTTLDLACAINHIILELLNMQKLGYDVAVPLSKALALEATIPD